MSYDFVNEKMFHEHMHKYASIFFNYSYLYIHPKLHNVTHSNILKP